MGSSEEMAAQQPECQPTIDTDTDMDTDTDGSASEDEEQDEKWSEDGEPVEKWSEFVEKYMTNVNSLPADLRLQITSKPVFLLRNVRKWRQRARTMLEQSQNVNTAQKKDDEKQKSGGSSPKAEAGDMEMSDNTRCKFNLNSFNMVFVVNSESYLYKHRALRKAKESHKQVSLKFARKFKTWYHKWSEQQVTGDMQRLCSDWMMGRGEGLVPQKTRLLTNNDLNRAPYIPFNSYRVEI